MFNKFKKKIIILISIIASFCISYGVISYVYKYSQKNNHEYINTLDYNLFQSGDLIFRKGQGILGQALFQVDKNAEYSHVGIVKLFNNHPFIIHASTGENFGDDAIVIIESLEKFLKKEFTNAIAIYRLKNIDAKIGNKVTSIAYKYAQEKIPFDKEFNIQTEDSFYCTELVWRAYLSVGIDLVDGQFSYIKMPFAQKEYLLTSGLENSPYIKLIYELKLEENSS